MNDACCERCGSGDDGGRITFVEGECYSCAKSGICFGQVPMSPDGISQRELNERQLEWGRGNLGVELSTISKSDLVDRATEATTR